LVTASFGLTEEQINKIQIAYNIGKTIKARDGMTFEKGLPSVMGQESSFGVYVVGDKWDNGKLKSLYESSLGNMQIKLSTAKITIKKYPNLMKKYGHLIYEGESIYMSFEKHKRLMQHYTNITKNGLGGFFKSILIKNEHLKMIRYYSNILNNPKWIDKYNRGTKQGISTIKWATRELDYHSRKYDRDVVKLKKTVSIKYAKTLVSLSNHKKQYYSLLKKANKDTKLINMLLTNYKFGVEVGGHYLLWMYEIAVDKGFTDAYWRAIGRYNGGWNNLTYQEKVRGRMTTIENLISKGIITS
jgi:hypothetical protein